jgi:hypothetical protein
VVAAAAKVVVAAVAVVKAVEAATVAAAVVVTAAVVAAAAVAATVTDLAQFPALRTKGLRALFSCLLHSCLRVSGGAGPLASAPGICSIMELRVLAVPHAGCGEQAFSRR